jgi:hypothetical protein
VPARDQPRNLAAFYDEISASYRAIDDFRMKLLGFLPVATGGAVFLLLNSKIGDEPSDDLKVFLAAIGTLGFAFTTGLFAYELHGIKKCHSYIHVGKLIEIHSKLPGQFIARPRDLGGLINEPFASSVIYPASLAAWVYGRGLSLTHVGHRGGALRVPLWFRSIVLDYTISRRDVG